jgi:antitoxin component of RelBE/YafQ-DinJ toxin-antitoxin module
MSVLFRCRINPKVLSKADKVTSRLGTSTPEMVRIFVTQIARTGKVPVSLECGAEDAVAGPWKQRAETLESFYDATKAW